MFCLDEGILRARIDGELTQYETLAVDRHVTLCDECADLYRRVAGRSSFMSPALAILDPEPGELRVDSFAAQCAFTRFKAHYDVDFEPATSIGELSLLLPDESLAARLLRELRFNWADFKRNPLLYLHYAFSAEANSPVRRQRLRKGTAYAMASYGLVFASLIIAGVVRKTIEKPIQEPAYRVYKLGPLPPQGATAKSPPELAAAGNFEGLKGGDKLLSDPLLGGGGGGRETRERAPLGAPPQFSQLPPLMPPQPNPGPEKASLVVPETIAGDPAPGRGSRTGLADGADTQASGPGHPSGLGQGQGSGAGPGAGQGAGPGRLSNSGSGERQTGGGLGDGSLRSGTDEVFEATMTMQPTIIFREKARYTEEARTKGVRGDVVLSAVFGADGRVRQVNTVQPLPFGLTESAIEALSKIRFRPAMRDGKPVSVRMQLVYTFNLY